jgi:hypothetical protein
LLAAETLLSGCGAVRSTRPGSAERTILEVDNQGLADMTIYVIHASQRMRIGFAPGLRKTELTIPRSAVSGTGQLAFLADPVGSSRTSVSEQIYVAPGDRVTIVIPP